MESRSAYGYYGEGHGVTGEDAPKEHARGWRFMDFHFEIDGTYQQTRGFNYIDIKACDYAHALKQAKKLSKRDGFTIVGDKQGYERQRNW